MAQACIYDYLSTDVDPVFTKIKGLEPGQEVSLGSGITVIRNTFHMYEIETDDVHDPARSVQNCYEKVLKLIDELSQE